MNLDEIKIEGKRVLVTGANGFIGSHCVRALLKENCLVRGTVRSLKDKKRYETLYELVPEKNKNLEIVEGDLIESNWNEIVKDCDFVLHIASPVFSKITDSEKLYNSGVMGTKNVLEACLKNNIKKVVVTSSIASMMVQKAKTNRYYTANDWTDEDCANLYCKIKVMAEKEAWRISSKSKGKMNLTVIAPGLVLGEYLMPNHTSSSDIIVRTFNSKLILPISLTIVSIEDVVLAHINSLKRPLISKGKRYILVENTYWMKDVRDIIESEFQNSYSFYHFFIPFFLIFILSFFVKSMKRIYNSYEIKSVFENDPVKEDLGVNYRNHRKYIIECIYSLIDKGFLPDRTKK